MGVREFLKPEKKKFVLPIILVFLLMFVLTLSVVYENQLSKDYDERVQDSLDTLKYVVYNATFNGTNKYFEQQTELAENRGELARDKLNNTANIFLTSYISEHILNTFGTNFCDMSFGSIAEDCVSRNSNTVLPVLYGTNFCNISFVSNIPKTCVSTNFDTILPIDTMRLSHCASQFAGTIVSKVHIENYLSVTEEEKIAANLRLRNFILSEEGQNIFENLEFCKFSGDRLDYYETVRNNVSVTVNYVPFLGSAIFPEIKTIDPLGIMLFSVILIITGYMMSCFALWIHRHNKQLYGKGKKTYISIVVFTLLFFVIGVFGMREYYSSYIPFATPVPDFSPVFFTALIFSYITTTVLWEIYGRKKESKILRDVYKKKSKK